MANANLAPVPEGQMTRGPRYTYKFPAAARLLETDPSSVTLVPLTLEQETHGNRLVEQSKNFFDKILLAVVAVDGRTVNWNEASSALDRMSPKVRDLIGRAYIHLHSPSDEESADFLGSVQLDM